MLKRVFAAVGIILASIPLLFIMFMLWFEYFRCGPTFMQRDIVKRCLCSFESA